MFILLKACNSEFSYIIVWFTNQISKLIYIKDAINVSLTKVTN